MSKSSDITLPPRSCAALRDLYAKSQHAKELYDVALNSALEALGLDHTKGYTVHLDTGVIDPPKE